MGQFQEYDAFQTSVYFELMLSVFFLFSVLCAKNLSMKDFFRKYFISSLHIESLETASSVLCIHCHNVGYMPWLFNQMHDVFCVSITVSITTHDEPWLIYLEYGIGSFFVKILLNNLVTVFSIIFNLGWRSSDKIPGLLCVVNVVRGFAKLNNFQNPKNLDRPHPPPTHPPTPIQTFCWKSITDMDRALKS